MKFYSGNLDFCHANLAGVWTSAMLIAIMKFCSEIVASHSGSLDFSRANLAELHAIWKGVEDLEKKGSSGDFLEGDPFVVSQ